MIGNSFTARRLEVVLELGPDLAARAVQQHALVAGGELERLRDLLRLPALDVAQDDDLLLARRQLGDRGADLLQRLGRQQLLVGHPRPAVRRDRPAARVARVARRAEAVRVDRGLVLVLRRERGHRHAARLPLPARTRAVGDDPQDPGLQARAALEAVQPLQDAEPGLLHDLFGHRAGAHMAERDPQHQRPVLVHERHERVLVACLEALEQSLVLVDDQLVHEPTVPLLVRSRSSVAYYAFSHP